MFVRITLPKPPLHMPSGPHQTHSVNCFTNLSLMMHYMAFNVCSNVCKNMNNNSNTRDSNDNNKVRNKMLTRNGKTCRKQTMKLIATLMKVAVTRKNVK